MNVTELKVAANRANAEKSSGPRTPEGKEASKYNRLSHGLASPVAVLPFECREEYDALYESFCKEHNPEGPTAEGFVRLIADAHWKLQRLARIEQEAFTAMLDVSQNEAKPEGEAVSQNEPKDPFAALAASLLGSNRQTLLNSLSRYQATLNRQIINSVNALMKYQREQKYLREEELKKQIVQKVTGLKGEDAAAQIAIDLLANDTEAIDRYCAAYVQYKKAGAHFRTDRPARVIQPQQ